MNVSYNFLSLVALGSFNPAIVTPDFLNTICQLNLGEPYTQSPPEFPVHRDLEFNRLQFIIDLDKYQIIQKGIVENDISQSTIIEIFETYHNKLPYTPLDAVGVNINCDLIIEKGEAISLTQSISDSKTYLDFFKVDSINVTERSLQTRTDKNWIGADFYIEKVHGLARRIHVIKKKDSITLNYNYEAGNLKPSLTKLGILIDGYSQFCDEFVNFLKHLEA